MGGGFMQNWKKVAIAASVGLGAVAFFSGRRPAGLALASVGLAMLASEYPETFEEVFEHGPDYLTRGVQIFGALSQVVENLTEQAARRSATVFHEITPDFGRRH
jgi:hypothetical protein